MQSRRTIKTIKQWQFDFVLQSYEEDAERLMILIEDYCDKHKLVMGGGYRELEETIELPSGDLRKL